MKYFICSVGKPNKDYVEENLNRIIDNKCFVLNEYAKQKGAINEISINDIIILKYNKSLIAYGKAVTEFRIGEEEEWNHCIDIEKWFFYNTENLKEGIPYNGIGNNTISGGAYGVVKEVESDFGLCKIKEIDSLSDLYKEIEQKEIFVNNMKLMQEKIDLLKYKKQIILQGPPGTGKTKLAKEIAYEILNSNPQRDTPLEMIENFFKKGISNTSYNKDFENRLVEFYSVFSKDDIDKMKLDDYCIGRGNRNNFCWWIEVGLGKFGKFSPGTSKNYIIYFSKDKDDYSITRSNESKDVLFPKIKKALQKLINSKDFSLASEFFGEGFIIKILNSYYPQEFFPINGRNALVNCMRLFEREHKSITTLDLNKILQGIFEEYKKRFPSDITSLDFMAFLFNKFDLNKTGDLFNQESNFFIDRLPEIVQFHPSYTYEDFIRGIVAESEDKGINYVVKNKILAELINEAMENPYSDYVLIIDEINRANLSSVLGELIYALEYRYYFNATEVDNKMSKVESIYALENKETGEITRELCIPENLYIIGTMNTADRSVGHIDYAIRRRFAFVDVLPKDLSVDKDVVFDTELFKTVQRLFTIDDKYNKASQYLSSEFDCKEVALGHSYFIDKKIEGGVMDIRLEYEIKPILREYIRDGILIGSDISQIVEDLKATL